MAWTPGTESVKIINVSLVNFNGVVSVSGDNILDGMTFTDQPDKTLKMASGIETVVSEKTTVTMDLVGMTDAEVTSLKSLDGTVADYILITLDSGDDIRLLDVIPSILKTNKAGEPNKITFVS